MVDLVAEIEAVVRKRIKTEQRFAQLRVAGSKRSRTVARLREHVAAEILADIRRLRKQHNKVEV